MMSDTIIGKGFILLNDFVKTPDYPLMTPIAMRFSPCGNSRMIN